MEEFQSLLILMVAVWIFGKIFRSLHLPVIFGELLGGIVVGPLVFNVIPPDSELIKVLAELGIFFLMLHAGLETDPSKLLKASKKSFLIAAGGLILPLIGGFLVSKYFGFTTNESLFIAVGISVTAIAISIRIFKDYKLQNTHLANIVVSAAIISDIVILVLFSMILKLIENGSVDLLQSGILLGKILLFFGIVIIGGFKIQKYVGRFYQDKGFTLTLIIALALGLIAEWIGLHMVIGAFLAGLFIREEVLDEKIFNKIEDRIYGLSYSFLGPVFFASLAFNLNFQGLFANPAFLIAIFLTAFLGKLIGAGSAALMQKIKAKKALIIGLAMNSRGVVDLIIASIGLQKGIISREVFSILVAIAFLSTMISIFAIKPIKHHISVMAKLK